MQSAGPMQAMPLPHITLLTDSCVDNMWHTSNNNCSRTRHPCSLFPFVPCRQMYEASLRLQNCHTTVVNAFTYTVSVEYMIRTPITMYVPVFTMDHRTHEAVSARGARRCQSMPPRTRLRKLGGNVATCPGNKKTRTAASSNPLP